MTENEAINHINLMCHCCVCWYGEKCHEDGYCFETMQIAIQALEEIQQYRALEEKLNGISVEQVVNGFISTVEKETQEGYERGRILTNSDVDMWNEYRAIGTVAEFKALKEKEQIKQ